jgi:hypothetical protein
MPEIQPYLIENPNRFAPDPGFSGDHTAALAQDSRGEVFMHLSYVATDNETGEILAINGPDDFSFHGDRSRIRCYKWKHHKHDTLFRLPPELGNLARPEVNDEIVAHCYISKKEDAYKVISWEEFKSTRELSEDMIASKKFPDELIFPGWANPIDSDENLPEWKRNLFYRIGEKSGVTVPVKDIVGYEGRGQGYYGTSTWSGSLKSLRRKDWFLHRYPKTISSSHPKCKGNFSYIECQGQYFISQNAHRSTLAKFGELAEITNCYVLQYGYSEKLESMYKKFISIKGLKVTVEGNCMQAPSTEDSITFTLTNYKERIFRSPIVRCTGIANIQELYEYLVAQDNRSTLTKIGDYFAPPVHARDSRESMRHDLWKVDRNRYTGTFYKDIKTAFRLSKVFLSKYKNRKL